MHFHLASLIWIAYAGDIDWTLTLIGITIIGIIAIDNSIATSTANKSGATLKSNYSKITQGKQSYTNNS